MSTDGMDLHVDESISIDFSEIIFSAFDLSKITLSTRFYLSITIMILLLL